MTSTYKNKRPTTNRCLQNLKTNNVYGLGEDGEKVSHH